MKSNIKKKSKRSSATKPLPLEINIQFSDELSAAVCARFKNIFSKKNVAHWLCWAINPDAPHLREVTLRVVGALEGSQLNEQFRGRKYATNILTFNAYANLNTQSDLLVCAPVVMDEAKRMGIKLKEHCAHLLIHGALHAQGFDHEAGPREEMEMESIESYLMLALGFKDPYRQT